MKNLKTHKHVTIWVDGILFKETITKADRAQWLLDMWVKHCADKQGHEVRLSDTCNCCAAK